MEKELTVRAKQGTELQNLCGRVATAKIIVLGELRKFQQ